MDSELRLISRIKRDLSGRQIIVSQGISGAESLAVDWIAGKNVREAEDSVTGDIGAEALTVEWIICKNGWRLVILSQGMSGAKFVWTVSLARIKEGR